MGIIAQGEQVGAFQVAWVGYIGSWGGLGGWEKSGGWVGVGSMSILAMFGDFAKGGAQVR